MQHSTSTDRILQLCPTPSSDLFSIQFLQSGQGMKLTTHLYLVPKLSMCVDLYLQPPYVFMAWCNGCLHGVEKIVKHRDNFTFTFILVTPHLSYMGMPLYVGTITDSSTAKPNCTYLKLIKHTFPLCCTTSFHCILTP
jgi:hypothetical protein